MQRLSGTFDDILAAARRCLNIISLGMSPRIPHELCDYIIDYHGEDLATLQSLSLVCQAWVASARRHLFRVIRTTAFTPEEVKPVRDQVAQSGHVGVLSSFTEMLVSKSGPTLYTAVQEIHLVYGDIQLHVLTEICDALPCLQVLSMRNLNILRTSGQALSIRSRFGCLDTLKIKNCDLACPTDEFFRLVRGFRSVKRLDIFALRMLNNPDDPGWTVPLDGFKFFNNG